VVRMHLCHPLTVYTAADAGLLSDLFRTTIHRRVLFAGFKRKPNDYAEIS
jgi:hypothetical protein